MRTTLVSMLLALSQWATTANAQPQTAPLPTARPAAPNWTLIHPPTKRLFFFTSDPRNPGRPTVFGRPTQSPRIGGVSYSPLNKSARFQARPSASFPSTSLLPKKTLPPQDLWKFVRPKNTRTFFFNKQ